MAQYTQSTSKLDYSAWYKIHAKIDAKIQSTISTHKEKFQP